MPRIARKIEILFAELIKNRLIDKLTPEINLFTDEPRIFYYHGVFKNNVKIQNKINSSLVNNYIETAGISFFSKSEALLKCLAEGVERISLYNHNRNDFVHYRSRKNGKFGWVKGYNLTENKICNLPAQSISIGYYLESKEKPLSIINSTGAASGFDLKSALLRSIYEIIEKDALMTIYLNKISVPQFKTEILFDKNIEKLNKIFKRYQLTWKVLDFTNDLQIPVIVSLLIDRSGYGPAVSFGAKCSFNIIENIISSAEEAVMLRNTARILMNNFYTHKFMEFNLRDRILLKRINLWWPLTNMKKLEYMVSSSEISSLSHVAFENREAELSGVVSSLKQKGHQVFYKDITADYFKEKSIFVTKAIIPSLQPLYLDEEKREINKVRNQNVANYFNKKSLINSFPHPFL